MQWQNHELNDFSYSIRKCYSKSISCVSFISVIQSSVHIQMILNIHLERLFSPTSAESWKIYKAEQCLRSRKISLSCLWTFGATIFSRGLANTKWLIASVGPFVRLSVGPSNCCLFCNA